MDVDLIIRGGTVVDGTGAAARRADVAIAGDRIVAVEDRIDARAEREIDAEGRVVTPGFVDVHTHLDAQLGWDPLPTSSCWHGITSVVLGNCGVTFAPVGPGQREFLAEMMESVEDIPRRAILEGLPWDWTTYGDYLGWLDRTPEGHQRRRARRPLRAARGGHGRALDGRGLRHARRHRPHVRDGRGGAAGRRARDLDQPDARPRRPGRPSRPGHLGRARRAAGVRRRARGAPDGACSKGPCASASATTRRSPRPAPRSP